MTHNWEIKKQKFFLFAKQKFPADKLHPGYRSRYGKYGPRSGYGFLRTACQPIRIENFEKPYNKKNYQTANFGLDNSSYRAQPHSIIVKYLTTKRIVKK
jgi:hypothetical protein